MFDIQNISKRGVNKLFKYTMKECKAGETFVIEKTTKFSICKLNFMLI